MLDLGQIFSQIWFFIPILIIAIILKVFMNKISDKNRKDRYKKLMKGNKQKGIEYEKKCGKFYEEQGYEAEYNGIINDKKDGGIDLICKKDNEVKILVQCKAFSEEKVINHENIKVFHSNATKYMDLNKLNRKNIELKYTVPDAKVFDSSALKVFRNKYYKCSYDVI